MPHDAGLPHLLRAWPDKAVEILESITEGFFTLDREWRFDYVNAEAHRILGMERGALARRILWEVYPGLEGTPFWDSYHQTMDDRAKTSFTAYYANQARWYEVTVFPAPEGISVYFRDVSEAKRLDAQREALVAERAASERVLRASEEKYRLLSAELVEAGRMKDEFLATLAHELRNPLAPIRNALKIQSLAAHDPALMSKTREIMERQVAHMVRLIDDLLDVSRLSRGLVDLKIERVSLASTIALALEASRPLIEQSSHALAVKLPGEDLIVAADPVRITQIITNLLNNAAKFTPNGGKLSLSLERDGEHALVRVSDNGIGLRADMLDRVFNMFEQVDRSYAEVSGGLGIGLTLVRRLVEAQGGRVHATSDGVGTGSEFVVCLPLAPRHVVTAMSRSGDAPPARPVPRQRILVADDNVDAATSLAIFLEMSGHETRVVTDGAQAMIVAAEFRPHVAILDIAMPVLDGLGAARAIRASPSGDTMLLIALSGFGQDADRRRSTDAGLDEHLVKPVDLALVERLIATNPYRR